MPDRPTTEIDLKAIRQWRKRELAAGNRGDVEALVALRTNDFVTMPPHQPPVKGIPAFRKWIDGMLQRVDWDWKLRSDEVVVANDWAFDRGTYEAVIRPKSSTDVQEDEGKYLWVLRREDDGAWRIAVAIWNSSRPQRSHRKAVQNL